jgi:hypothetical protein
MPINAANLTAVYNTFKILRPTFLPRRFVDQRAAYCVKQTRIAFNSVAGRILSCNFAEIQITT